MFYSRERGDRDEPRPCIPHLIKTQRGLTTFCLYFFERISIYFSMGPQKRHEHKPPPAARCTSSLIKLVHAWNDSREAINWSAVSRTHRHDLRGQPLKLESIPLEDEQLGKAPRSFFKYWRVIGVSVKSFARVRELPSSLVMLDAKFSNLTSFRSLSYRCPRLLYIDLYSSPVSGTHWLKNMENLTGLDLQCCWHIKMIDQVPPRLRHLDMSLTRIANIDALQGARELQYLRLDGCSKLRNVNGLKDHRDLYQVSMIMCFKLSNLAGLLGCLSLRVLEVTFAPITSLCGLEQCEVLEVLDAGCCSFLADCSSISFLRELKKITLDRTAVSNLDFLTQSRHLTFASFKGCNHLEDISGLQNASGLKSLCLDECSRVTTLDLLNVETRVGPLLSTVQNSS